MSPTLPGGIQFVAAHPVLARKGIRIRDWFTLPTIISFTAGILTNLRFQFGGKASVGELVLAAVALFAVLANVGNRRFWERRMLFVLFTLCVSFSGYIVSDLINATPPDRLVRGWARMAFVIIDFIAIWALARKSFVNLFAICIGDALSTLLSWGDERYDFLYAYKFHFAMPATVLIMVAMPLLLRKRANMATGMAMVCVGMCHIWFDFRMAGGTCILIGFVLIARCITASRLRSLYLGLLALALILSSFSVGYLYLATNTEFANRRQGSNSQRLQLALAGLNAIERSPVFGLGSWTWDTEMWNIFIANINRADAPNWSHGEAMGPHSQIIQVWAEAGLLGLIFFLYFGKLLAEALWVLFFRRPLDIMSPLFLYYLLVAVWNVLFSPFANLHRFLIGLALVISIQVLRERGSGRNHAPNTIFVTIGARGVEPTCGARLTA